MITLQTTVVPAENVLATTLHNDETVLLHMDRQSYYSLNKTGGEIWQGLVSGDSLPQIHKELEDRYEAKQEELKDSLLALLEELQAEDLIRIMI